MVIEASKVVKGGLSIEGQDFTDLNSDGLSLRWRAWHPPTYEDRQYEAQALQLNVTSGVMSRESAVAALAPTYDIEDVDSELQAIEKDQRTLWTARSRWRRRQNRRNHLAATISELADASDRAVISHAASHWTAYTFATLLGVAGGAPSDDVSLDDIAHGIEEFSQCYVTVNSDATPVNNDATTLLFYRHGGAVALRTIYRNSPTMTCARDCVEFGPSQFDWRETCTVGHGFLRPPLDKFRVC